jgi:7-cyano-7-deazaguanine synthase
MDSCVTAAIAARNHDIAALHATYGQRTAERELKCFNQLADHFSVSKRLVAQLDYFSDIGGSSLTDSRLPVLDADLTNKRFRTTTCRSETRTFWRLLRRGRSRLAPLRSLLAQFARTVGCIPTAGPSTTRAMNALIRAGTSRRRILRWNAFDLANEAGHRQTRQRIGRAVHLTWSCYRETKKHAGVCDSCALRLRAFQEAGVEDPIAYRTRPEYSRSKR